MKPFKQRTKSDCGIAAAAMVAGCSYTHAKRTFGRCNGMEDYQLQWLIEELTSECWRLMTLRKPRPVAEVRVNETCLGIVSKAGPVMDSLGYDRHIVAISPDEILDPSQEDIEHVRQWTAIRLVVRDIEKTKKFGGKKVINLEQ